MYHEKSIHVILFVRALKDETTHIYGTPKETHQVFMIFATKPPHRPDSNGYRWLPDCMEESRPVRTKALYPIFADRRTRTGSVLKQFAGEGLT